MERLSDRAIEILNDLHTERLEYNSEYLPLIEAAHKLAEYEATGMEPSEIQCAKENLHILDLFKEQAQDAEECIRIAEARRDGRLVVLPCKIGDKVREEIADYVFTVQKIETVKVYGENHILFRCGNGYTEDYMAFYDFEIGDHVTILPREKADADLKTKEEADA